MKCVLCNNEAKWAFIKKNCPDGLKYLCESHLMSLPNPADRIDNYKFIEKRKSKKKKSI